MHKNVFYDLYVTLQNNMFRVVEWGYLCVIFTWDVLFRVIFTWEMFFMVIFMGDNSATIFMQLNGVIFTLSLRETYSLELTLRETIVQIYNYVFIYYFLFYYTYFPICFLRYEFIGYHINILHCIHITYIAFIIVLIFIAPFIFIYFPSSLVCHLHSFN